MWIDESSFSSASLPLYSWMPKGWDAERVIRKSSKRYNVIATQWNKESYFVIKSVSTNEASFINIVLELDKELRIRLDQNTYEKRMIVIYDNASIHKTKKVRVIMKNAKVGGVYNSYIFTRAKSNRTYIWYFKSKNFKKKF